MYVIKSGLYDCYNSPSDAKKCAYKKILDELATEPEMYEIFVTGNTHIFKVTAIDIEHPLAQLPNHSIYPAIIYTKNGKKKTTITIK